jgi:hypothetical protein
MFFVCLMYSGSKWKKITMQSWVKGGQKDVFGSPVRQACRITASSANFTVTVLKGLKDTTRTHRPCVSIFPRLWRVLFQSSSRVLRRARKQRGGMRAAHLAHKTLGRLTFWNGLGVRTSGRSRTLAPLCLQPLTCSHLERHQPPALPTRFWNFVFFTFMHPINGSQPLFDRPTTITPIYLPISAVHPSTHITGWTCTVSFYHPNKRRRPLFLWKQDHSETAGYSIYLPYTIGGMHSHNKHDRHTDSRFSLLEDNPPRDGRGSQDQASTRRRSWETFVSNWIERITCGPCLLQR